jgi:hypothetical protein
MPGLSLLNSEPDQLSLEQQRQRSLFHFDDERREYWQKAGLTSRAVSGHNSRSSEMPALTAREDTGEGNSFRPRPCLAAGCETTAVTCKRNAWVDNVGVCLATCRVSIRGVRGRIHVDKDAIISEAVSCVSKCCRVIG